MFLCSFEGAKESNCECIIVSQVVWVVRVTVLGILHTRRKHFIHVNYIIWCLNKRMKQTKPHLSEQVICLETFPKAVNKQSCVTLGLYKVCYVLRRIVFIECDTFLLQRMRTCMSLTRWTNNSLYILERERERVDVKFDQWRKTYIV